MLQTTQLHLDALTSEWAHFWSARSRQEGTMLLKGWGADVSCLHAVLLWCQWWGHNSYIQFPCTLHKEGVLLSTRITCQAAQASISQPSIFFNFFQLLQVQTQLLGKEPQQNVITWSPCPWAALQQRQTHIPNQPSLQEIKPRAVLCIPPLSPPSSISPASGPWAAKLIGKQFSPSSNITFPWTRFPWRPTYASPGSPSCQETTELATGDRMMNSQVGAQWTAKSCPGMHATPLLMPAQPLRKSTILLVTGYCSIHHYTLHLPLPA